MLSTVYSPRPKSVKPVKRATLTTRCGVVTYQTRPLRQARAISFARCLEANRGISGAEVLPCMVKADRYRVYWMPVGVAAQDAMFEKVQTVQVTRARIERGGYVIEPNGDGSAEICGSRGEWYHTTATGCTCPQFEHRLKGTGISCKHQVAFALYLAETAK